MTRTEMQRVLGVVLGVILAEMAFSASWMYITANAAFWPVIMLPAGYAFSLVLVPRMRSWRLSAGVRGFVICASLIVTAIWLGSACLVARIPLGNSVSIYLGGGSVTLHTGAELSTGAPRYYCRVAPTIAFAGRFEETYAGGSSPGQITTVRSWPLWPMSVVLLVTTVQIVGLTRRAYASGLCQQCGYDLRGTRSGRCSECGASY